MFEKTRSNLVSRLGDLIDRFEKIEQRASKQRNDASLAASLGLGSGTIPYDEMVRLSIEQAALCGQSITALLVRRAWPLMFKKGVRRAEQFADQCDAILDQSEAGAAFGRARFQERFGITERNHAPNN